MTQEVVFDTEAACDAQQASDYADEIAAIEARCICVEPEEGEEQVICKHCRHKALTTSWSEKRQRLDGKWAYDCREGSDYTGLTVEDYDPNNYASEE